MLRTIKQLQGLPIRAKDGEIGKVRDVYFDDKEWVIRYIVADTGNWLSGRRVLLAPAAFSRPDWAAQALPVNLTKEQIENAPGTDVDKPVARQHEVELSAYYGWPAYWTTLPPIAPTMTYGAPGSSNPGFAPSQPVPEDHSPPVKRSQTTQGDPHLRSSKEVIGYKIEARDGRIGQVEDFVFDDETWSIDYMVVDTGGWLTGRKVMLAASWVQAIDWEDSRVRLDLQRETIQNSPEFDPAQVLGEE